MVAMSSSSGISVLGTPVLSLSSYVATHVFLYGNPVFLFGTSVLYFSATPVISLSMLMINSASTVDSDTISMSSSPLLSPSLSSSLVRSC